MATKSMKDVAADLCRARVPDQEAGGRYRQNRRIRFRAYTVQTAALAVIGQGARRANEVAD